MTNLSPQLVTIDVIRSLKGVDKHNAIIERQKWLERERLNDIKEKKNIERKLAIFQAKKKGKCGYCLIRKAEDDREFCKKCLEYFKIKSKKRTERRKAKGLCYQCGKHKHKGEGVCKYCRQRNSELYHEQHPTANYRKV